MGLSLIDVLDGEGCTDDSTLKMLGLPLYIAVMVWLFIATFVICDHYFVPSLEIIGRKMRLPADVQGATIMAVGTSLPELLTGTIGAFLYADENPGPATNIGSAIFNMAIIIGASILFTPDRLTVSLLPLARDSFVYALSLLLICFVWYWTTPGSITALEASVLLLAYFSYVAFLAYCAYRAGGGTQNETGDHAAGAASADADGVHVEDDGPGNNLSTVLLPPADHVCDDDDQGALLPTLAVALALPEEEKTSDGLGRTYTPLPGRRIFSMPTTPRGARTPTQEDDSPPLIRVRFNPETLTSNLTPHKPRAAGNLEAGILSSRPLSMPVRSTTPAAADGMARLYQGRRTRLSFRVIFQRVEDNIQNKRKSRRLSRLSLRAALQTTALAQECGDRSRSRRRSASLEVESADPMAAMAIGMETDEESFRWGEAVAMCAVRSSTCVLNFLAAPFELAFRCTVPAPQTYPRLFVASLCLSIGWIAIFTFLIVDLANKSAECLNINADLTGVTVLAVGSSLPDFFSSIIVAQEGKGDMAIANALGSNIFDILVCVGLPFTLKALATGPIQVNSGSGGVLPLVLTAAGFMAAFLVCVAMGSCTPRGAQGQRMVTFQRWQGWAWLVAYSIFVVIYSALNV